jgi:hypothetical protein
MPTTFLSTIYTMFPTWLHLGGRSLCYSLILSLFFYHGGEVADCGILGCDADCGILGCDADCGILRCDADCGILGCDAT